MTNDLHAGVLVIGFGKGGKAVAKQMGELGKRVILVEQSDRMYGGTCPNVGCVPTKMLVHLSRKRREADLPQDFYEHAVGDVQALTTRFRGGNYEALNGADTVTVITGKATFVDPHTVTVTTADEQFTVTGDTILINTGSQPVIPDIPGMRASRYTVTSTDLIQQPELPKRLGIIGGGYLGIEFSSIYRRFGSEVTVLEAAPKILGRQDDDVAAVAEGILRGEGIEILTGVHVTEIRDGGTTATIAYERTVNPARWRWRRSSSAPAANPRPKASAWKRRASR